MTLSFKPLQESHFPLLLKWLETPHVKTWWDTDVQWTPELIKEKFGTYVQGYKVEQGIKKPFQAYIIYVDTQPVGYIQLYTAHDFARDYPASLETLPLSLAALDFFIGEQDYLGQGLAPVVLTQFLQEYVAHFYEACFVDPETTNIRAIRVYEKAGFKTVKTIKEEGVTWMVWEKIGGN